MSVSLSERIFAVLYALDGQAYVAPDGSRLEVVNIRSVRRLLQAIFLAGLLAAIALWFVTPLLALAVVPGVGALVAATLLFAPSMKRTEGARRDGSAT